MVFFQKISRIEIFNLNIFLEFWIYYWEINFAAIFFSVYSYKFLANSHNSYLFHLIYIQNYFSDDLLRKIVFYKILLATLLYYYKFFEFETKNLRYFIIIPNSTKLKYNIRNSFHSDWSYIISINFMKIWSTNESSIDKILFCFFVFL
jgi:hypothetical protein